MQYSFGQYPKLDNQTDHSLWWTNDSIPDEKFVLPVGNRLSYGDSCQNENGILLNTKYMNRFIDFDHTHGLITCESGVTLGDILALSVPRGWFLPSLPGTQSVTLGGAIANDVHGKNHWHQGSFGQHITSLMLRRSNGDYLPCSQNENADYFRATIAGLGLTGLITEATIQLTPIQSNAMSCQHLSFQNIEQCFELMATHYKGVEYMVGWLDLNPNRHYSRGILSTACHHNEACKLPQSKKINIPFNLPSWALNKKIIQWINQHHYHKQLKQPEITHFEPYFFPLDTMTNWNRIYGQRGFIQYQCVLPQAGCIELIKALQSMDLPVFLTTIKKMGSITPAGMLSFAQEGFTVAFDIPMKDPMILTSLEKIDAIVLNHGGKIYPAKDARMSAQLFEQCYQQLGTFKQYIDPGFSSSFWRRVSGEKIC